jgi:hypothetical protein
MTDARTRDQRRPNFAVKGQMKKQEKKAANSKISYRLVSLRTKGFL